MINMTNKSSRHRRIGIATGALTTVGLVAGFVAPLHAQADPEDACSGVKATCTVVADTDVTGDGRKDSVGIVIRNSDGDMVTRYQVRVRTATGRLLRNTDKHAEWAGKVFYGAGNLDGRPGKDLVVGHLAGAHTAFYHALSYHDGKLALLKAPKLPKRIGATTSGRSWVVDGAISSFEGIRRTTPHGHVVITDTFGSRNPSDKRYTGWTLRYRWDANRWKLISTEHRTFTNKKAAKLMGWHVKGLHKGF